MKASATYQTEQRPAILLVGEPKTGKTRLAYGAPKPFILDLDRNLHSAINVEERKFFYEQIEIPEDASELKGKVTPWTQSVAALKEACASPEVDTIIVDSLSTLAEVLVIHILHEVRRAEGKAIDRLRIQDYQPLKKLMANLVTYLRSSGKFIIYTAHQKTTKDEMTGVLRYQLNMPGQLADNFGAYFSDVWATEAQIKRGELKYVLHTKPTRQHISLGNSIGLMPEIDLTDKPPSVCWDTVMSAVETSKE